MCATVLVGGVTGAVEVNQRFLSPQDPLYFTTKLSALVRNYYIFIPEMFCACTKKCVKTLVHTLTPRPTYTQTLIKDLHTHSSDCVGLCMRVCVYVVPNLLKIYFWHISPTPPSTSRPELSAIEISEKRLSEIAYLYD